MLGVNIMNRLRRRGGELNGVRGAGGGEQGRGALRAEASTCT